MNMKKQLLPAFLVLGILLAGLSGCGEQTKPDTGNAQSPLETVTYANLTDGDSRALLTAALANAGVDESRVSAFFEKVDLFNWSVKSEWLTDGFESAAPTATKYDPYEMQDLWAEKNGSFPGYNCRITAFGLFGEFLTAGADQPDTQGEDALFLDNEKHKTVKQYMIEYRSIDTGIPVFLSTPPMEAIKGVSNGRGRKIIETNLSEWAGQALMCDAYAGYDWVKKAGRVLCRCSAHERRKFEAALKENPRQTRLV